MNLSIKEMKVLGTAQALYDAQEKRDFKLSLILVKNAKIIKGHLEDFEEARKSVIETPELVKFREGRQKIVDAYRVQKEDGSFEITQQNGQQVYKLDPSRLGEMNAKIAKYEEEHADVIKKEKEANEDLTKRHEEPIEVKLQSVTSPKHIEIMSTQTLAALAPIIKVKLTEKLLAEKGDKFTSRELERIMEYCKVG
jgi:predicted transcriptional regulator